MAATTAAAAALWLACAALAAGADGVIRGSVEIRRSQLATEARPASAALGAAPRRPVEFRPAVVYLDSAPRGAFELPEPGRASMDQRNQTFVPHVLAITVGTTVDFPNSDMTFHNVFSLSKTRAFDLGRYSRGKSKAVRFDRPGVVQVFCDIHSHMSAYILVFAHRYFAVTDQAGAFTIAGVPPGSYTLAVWHEGEVRETRTVTIPDAGGAVDAAFVIR
ncbi:MAG: carboxypeptidase regulatory-like domain-containing protein [Vicinamibacterales bacterium]|nr:carboxypeptidase regulatory-like domain-containing protein [Vicinamibacterales bacterium]